MTHPLRLDPDRLFPSNPAQRGIARTLYADIADLPIVSPHGHTDPAWFAEDRPGPTPPYHLFRGTPSRLWLDHVFAEVFGIDVRLDASTADLHFDAIGDALARPDFRPRALFDRFRIDFLATTEGARDDLAHHAAIRRSGWNGRVVTTYRPDDVVDVEHEQFTDSLRRFAELTGEDVYGWRGYLAAHRRRRADFRAAGATATDHGHPTVRTADLATNECEELFARIVGGEASGTDAELFRAQMLTEMARMSVEDGMVMQIRPGSFRNHDRALFAGYGRDRGADIPMRTDYVHSLKPMLDVVGDNPDLTVIIFTLDESSYTRELAPLAGVYPCLRLGPAWWFHDSPEGMRRYREMTTETAGFYNTVGFNDDTRAFMSIPARHDVARRVDCAFLARLVTDGRLEDWEAADLAIELTSGLVRRAYRV